MDALERSKVIDYIGRDHFFRWNQHALEYLWARLEPEYKARCPLNMPHPQARVRGLTNTIYDLLSAEFDLEARRRRITVG